jgi:hypothetical protein
MDIIDLTDVQWERNLTSYSSGGAYFKATRLVDGRTRYLKLSNYDDERGFIGFESVYEHLASRLGGLLGFAVLDSELLKARVIHNGREYVTFVQQTNDFLPPGRSKAPLERLYEAQKQAGETRLSFLRRQGFGTKYLADNLALIEDRSLRLPAFDRDLLSDVLFSVFDDDEDFPVWHRQRCLELIAERMARAQTLLDNR